MFHMTHMTMLSSTFFDIWLHLMVDLMVHLVCFHLWKLLKRFSTGGQKVDAWLDEGLVVGNGGWFWVLQGRRSAEDGDKSCAGRAYGSMLESGESRRWGESSERSHLAHCAQKITSWLHHLIVTFWLDLRDTMPFNFGPKSTVSCFSAKKSRWISKVNICCFGCCLILEFPLSNLGSVTFLRCFTCSNVRILSRINHLRREIVWNAVLASAPRFQVPDATKGCPDAAGGFSWPPSTSLTGWWDG